MSKPSKPRKLKLFGCFANGSRTMLRADVKRLAASIEYGLHDGLLSIANAEQMRVVMKPNAFESSARWQVSDCFQTFVSPEPSSGRRDRYNAFAFNVAQGQVVVIGRELSRKHAVALACGKKPKHTK